MKIQNFIIVLILFFSSYGISQNLKYDKLVREAWELYEAKDYPKSAATYKDAFDQIEGKAYPGDRYNAACSYALSNDTEQAFYHLMRLAESSVKYNNYGHITTDPDLTSLHADPRWEKLLMIVKANKDEAEKDLDKNLVAILDTIYRTDQLYRRQIDSVETKFGSASEEMKNHWKLINETDSINLLKVKKILDEKGWLGANVIGGQGNSALFLVIQHSDLETQVKYLPMMQEAVKNGNASPSSMALLEDRIALRQGKRQIYGSQIGRDSETGEYYVSPMIEPEKVNERRSTVGLGTIEEYISRWKIVWDVEKHKANTEKLEAEKKE